jgi:hypothetical protein
VKGHRGGDAGGAAGGAGGASDREQGAAGKRTLTDAIQRQAAPSSGDAGPAVGKQTQTGALPSGGGAPLPTPVQEKMGNAFDFDFSGVRVHEGEQAASVGALAYTQGSDLHFAPGQYDPSGRAGQELIGHELAHVVQQSEGRVGATTQFKGVAGNDDAGLEHEADVWGARAAAGESVGRSGSGASAAATGPVQRAPGPVTHTGTAGSGSVTVRENDESTPGGANDKISLEYKGKDADKAHWLQFVNFSMYADEPTGRVYNTGNVPTSSGTKPYSTDKVTNWSVDSASSSDPYYEAGFLNARDPGKGTKIWDKPGGASINGLAAQFQATKAPKATKVTFVASFDTYLVQNGTSDYHVTWSATTEYDVATKTSGSIAYHTGGGGAVAALPPGLKKVLDASYSGNKIT